MNRKRVYSVQHCTDGFARNVNKRCTFLPFACYEMSLLVARVLFSQGLCLVNQVMRAASSSGHYERFTDFIPPYKLIETASILIVCAVFTQFHLIIRLVSYPHNTIA